MKRYQVIVRKPRDSDGLRQHFQVLVFEVSVFEASSVFLNRYGVLGDFIFRYRVRLARLFVNMLYEFQNTRGFRQGSTVLTKTYTFLHLHTLVSRNYVQLSLILK